MNFGLSPSIKRAKGTIHKRVSNVSIDVANVHCCYFYFWRCEHLTDEVTRATSKNGENGSELACKHKLAHVGRTDSIISDISDLSR